MHFFTNDAGGNQMMYVNLTAWGYPEVYILILPAFGIFSEVVATFSGRLFSYRSMVWATLDGILSFMNWLHHFHQGRGRRRQRFLRIMSAIAVPTGVKVFNWLSRCSAAASLRTPMVFAVGFIIRSPVGGLTGALAVPPVIRAPQQRVLVALFTMSLSAGRVRRAGRHQLLVPEGVHHLDEVRQGWASGAGSSVYLAFTPPMRSA